MGQRDSVRAAKPSYEVPVTSAPLARFVLVGGFLGAGKTTAIGHFVEWLKVRGLKPGLITNDQGHGLVDTALARQRTEAIGEITGGCFCCRLDALVGTVQTLRESERPDVFLAEPVGSCTDLMATVILPLRDIYRVPLEIAALSVMLDGKRAYQMLGGRGRRSGFSKDVSYIYRKQLEEAEVLVVNKTDLLTNKQIEGLRAKLAGDYPGRRVFEICAQTGAGLNEWFEEALTGYAQPSGLMQVDYRRYGEGEALLGWLNATVSLRHPKGTDGAEVLHGFIHRVVVGLKETGIEVAHLKAALSDETAPDKLLRAQVTRGGEKPIFGGCLVGPIKSGRLIINLRAEGDPSELESVVLDSLAQALMSIPHEVVELARFRPSQPTPTHRVAELV